MNVLFTPFCVPVRGTSSIGATEGDVPLDPLVAAVPDDPLDALLPLVPEVPNV